MATSQEVLAQLEQVLKDRVNADPESSYTARLLSEGLDSILRKVSEENTELLLAAKDGDAKQVCHEMADLWYHNMVLLLSLGISHEDVLEQLAKRFGCSGIEEKQSRKKERTNV